jgi:hypothetical protein
MDIYILQEGQETGPYSEKAARQLLQQGDVAASDFACRAGMTQWVPLSELLAAEPSPVSAVKSLVPEPAEKAEPATPKQQALLSYLGIAVPAKLSRDQAARLVNDAMEDPGNAERLTLWNEDRLRLHPELFAGEIQAKKENRASHFIELCQTSGSKYFTGITKAHCQVLVGFLDVKFPHWDAREATAAEHYFFPAVAEKFPQLVQKQWRGRLHYVEGMKVAPEIVHKSPASKLQQSATSPFVAITRGLVLGVLILGVLYLGYRTMRHDVIAAPPQTGVAAAVEKTSAPSISTNNQLPPAPATNPQPAVTTATPPQSLPPIEPLAAVTHTEPPAASIAPPALPPVAVADPGISPPPMAADLAPPMAALPAAMAPMATPPGEAPPMAAAEPAMIPVSTSAVATAPMAALPGAEPPVPVPPPPATMPAPAALPSSVPEPAALPPATSPLPPTSPEPVTTTAKTNLLLTKPVEIQSTYGKIMLPPGTAVKLVSRQGAALKVTYRNTVINVPANSTDLE